MAAATKLRPRNSETARPNNGSALRFPVEFAVGSLEAELSAISSAMPASEWADVPADYFANLDHYLHRAPKKK